MFTFQVGDVLLKDALSLAESSLFLISFALYLALKSFDLAIALVLILLAALYILIVVLSLGGFSCIELVELLFEVLLVQVDGLFLFFRSAEHLIKQDIHIRNRVIK